VHVETLVFVGWGAVPVVAYAAGRVAIFVLERRPESPASAASSASSVPTTRLAELQSRRQAPYRGRVGEAVRFSEAGSALPVPRR
jgi:hypothetical protein